MADIVIRGMNAPKSCAECRVNCDMFMSGYLNGFTEGAHTRHPACPILALPEGHGDLIDRDALEKRARPIKNFADVPGAQVIVLGVVKCSPTIVPAEIEGVE